MSSDLDRIIVGNCVIYPALREVLKKSYYYMSYSPEKELITFSENDGGGGRILLELRNASYVCAQQLAKELGLKSDYSGKLPFWHKWNPHYSLWHDGSEGAENIRIEMLKLGLPFKLYNSPHGRDSHGNIYWGWSNGNHLYTPTCWTPEDIIKLLREDAERYRENLASIP